MQDDNLSDLGVHHLSISYNYHNVIPHKTAFLQLQQLYKT